MGGTRMHEAHAEQVARSGVAGGERFTGIERSVDLGEEAKRIGRGAEAGSLIEAALIPIDEGTVEQLGGRRVVGGEQRADRGREHGEWDRAVRGKEE